MRVEKVTEGNIKLRVNNVSLNVELRGPEHGLPLVLLHGFTGSAAGWKEHLSVFVENGKRTGYPYGDGRPRRGGGGGEAGWGPLRSPWLGRMTDERDMNGDKGRPQGSPPHLSTTPAPTGTRSREETGVVCGSRATQGSPPHHAATPAPTETSGGSLRVIAFDMLGHGLSDAPEDARRYGIEQCSADILAALRMLGVQAGEAVLLGYSMGGRIALYSAFSGFFRGLILESASAGIEYTREREARRRSDEVLAEQIERDGVPAFVAYWEQLSLFASQKALPDMVRQALHAQRLQNNAIGLANSLRGVGTGVQPALYDRLPTLDMPVLVLAGEHDTKFSGIARRMAQLLLQAQLEIVPSAGHTIHLEQPETFDRLVLDFIRSM